MILRIWPNSLDQIDCGKIDDHWGVMETCKGQRHPFSHHPKIKDKNWIPESTWIHCSALPSFSSERRHMTEKHVLIGCKHAMLGNQTFERFMIPFTYFAYWLRSHHLNHLISEILGQRNTWFEVSAYCLTKTSTNLKTFKLWCESLVNSSRTSNVWLPSMSCLRPFRTCFSVAHLYLDENNSMFKRSRDFR